MTVDHSAEDVDHTLRVEYGLALERVAELLHRYRQQYDVRAGHDTPVNWEQLTAWRRNEVRAALDQLAHTGLAQLEDLAYLSRRLTEVAG